MKVIVVISIMFSLLDIYSQQLPFGVSGNKAWFKTVVSEDKKSYIWKDFGGDDLKVLDSKGLEYKNKKVRYINFHAGLYVSSKANLESYLLGTSLAQGSIFAVFIPEKSFKEEFNLYGVSGVSGQGFLVTNDKVKGYSGSSKKVLDYGEELGRDLRYVSGDNIEGSLEDFKTTSARILTYERYAQPNTSVWGGSSLSSVLNIGIDKDKLNSPEEDKLNLSGYIPEILVFNRVLNPKERRRVESYLALKYGITLDENYLDSKNEILWDVEKNAEYHHRVTGIIKDTEGGLYQPFSTSTYDDTDFSYEHDSYDKYLSLHSTNVYDVKVSRKRLLSIGEGYKSKLLKEGNYAIWGDNSKSLKVKSPNNIGGLYLMDRVWKIMTNLEGFSELTSVSWELKDVIMREGASSEVKEVYKTTNNSNLGTAITNVPLIGYNGELSIRHSGKGNIFIYFGAKDNNDYNYGVELDWADGLYSIERGKRVKYLGVIPLAHRVIVIKEKDRIRLKHNHRELNYIIKIQPEDQEKVFHGKVGMYKNVFTSPLVKNLFVRGFEKKGMELELSYSKTKAEMFNPHAIKALGYTPYLIIDKTGKGDFTKVNNLLYVPYSYKSEFRWKLGFQNFMFDRDGSGLDAFTFGFKKEEEVLAYLKFEKPSCDSSLKGSLDVSLEGGHGSFKYELRGVEGTKYVGKEIVVSDRNFKVSDLEKGNYQLNIWDMYGTGHKLSKTFRLYGSCEQEEEEVLIDSFHDITKIKELSSRVSSNNIEVYPNPIEKNTPFWVSLKESESFVMSIYDSTGKLLDRQEVEKSFLDYKTKVRLSASATYFIKIDTKSGNQYYKKIIVY